METTNTITKPSKTLDLLNQTISEWRAQYDNPPELNAAFTAAADNRLLFNGYTLGVSLFEIVEESIYNDVQWFGFSTIYGADFDFKICWPFGDGQKPSVEYLRRSFPKNK